jgi:hypothetical protein
MPFVNKAPVQVGYLQEHRGIAPVLKLCGDLPFANPIYEPAGTRRLQDFKCFAWVVQSVQCQSGRS